MGEGDETRDRGEAREDYKAEVKKVQNNKRHNLRLWYSLT